MAEQQPATIRLADTGPLLGGRPLAAALRQLVIDRAASGQVVVDLDGIQAMSPSFADELFAKLDPQLLSSGRVRIQHANSRFAALVRVMMERRLRSSPSG
jgi:hypothetical protein